MMNYKIEIDTIPDDVWDQAARRFRDYTIYQTRAYQQVRAAENNQKISQVIIRDSQHDPVLMGVVRIRRVPLIGLRIGYIQWGPLIHSDRMAAHEEAEIWRSLKNAYVSRHVDVLRIVPNQVDDEKGRKLAGILGQSGFMKAPHVRPYHSIYLPVCEGEASIRSGFHRSWRRSLKKAEQNGLVLREGKKAADFQVLETIYQATRERKSFEGLNPQIFIQAQPKLRPTDQMHIIIAYFEGNPVTAHASSYLGEIGEGILAGSTRLGLELNASYLVWWRTLLSAREAGMRIYNLGGIDPRHNPSVTQFKKRMGGEEIYHIGTFDAVESTAVKICWGAIERAYLRFRK